MTPIDPKDEAKLVRKRQRARATVMALLLGGLVILFFAITIVKIRAGMGT
ncbi:hypothetical protein [Sphingomonas gilva]|nr:hypothetical protein [Sphingomonas gilva]